MFKCKSCKKFRFWFKGVELSEIQLEKISCPVCGEDINVKEQLQNYKFHRDTVEFVNKL